MKYYAGKKLTTIVLLTLLVFLLPLSFGLRGQSEEGETEYIIEEIQLTGNEKVTDKEVREQLGLKKGDSVSKKALNEKVEAVRKSGYFQNVSSDTKIDGEKIILKLELQEYPVLKKYEFTGVNLVGTGKLKQALRKAGVKKGEVINKTELNQGLKNISQKYKDQGYPLVSTGKIEIDSTLKIEIIEGKLVSFRMEGLRTVPEEVALDMVELKKGNPVKMKELQKTYQNLQSSIYFTSVELFPARGYSKSDIILRWKLEERQIIDEPVEATGIELVGARVFPEEELRQALEGLPESEANNYEVLKALAPVYRKYTDAGYPYVSFSYEQVKDDQLVIKVNEGEISQVVIEGNSKTERRIITNKLRFSPGDIIKSTDLVDSRRRLLNLGYFSEVELKPERASAGMKVVVKIEEKGRLNSINGGLTWTGSGLGGNLKLSTKNIFGLGQDISLDLNRKLSLDAKFGGSLDWKNVYYPSGFNFTKISLYRNVGSSQGVEASFGYPLSGNLSLNMGYNADWLLGDDAPANSLTHILSADLIYDDRNNPLFATAGTRRSLKLEKAGDFAPGLSFTQATFDASIFRGLPKLDIAGEKQQTFGFHLQLGLGLDTPPSYQSEFGGKNTIRGVEKGVASNYGFLNGEYRLQLLPGSLYVSTFVDSGVNFGDEDPFNFKASTGFEINLRLFGHLRIGGAWPIREDFGYVPTFYFGVGKMF